jgi:O-antigen/teichoic acid export membrane protein
VVGQVILLAASPAITRLYSPSEFGLAAVYASTLGVLIVVATLRYDVAIPIADDRITARDLAVLALAASVVTAASIAVVLAAVGNDTTPSGWLAELHAVRWAIPIGVLVLGCYQTFLYLAIREGNFGPLSGTRIAQAAASATTQLAAGFMSAGALGLILGSIAGQSSGALVLTRGLGAFRSIGSPLRWSGLRSTAQRFIRFPVVNVASGLANTLAFVLPPVLLAATYGPSVAGLFALSERAFATPVGLLARSIGHVFYADASGLARDPEVLDETFMALSRRLAAVALAALFALALFAPIAVEVAFGQQWRASGELARVLSLAYAGQLIVNPLSLTLVALERHSVILALDVTRSILVALAFAVPYFVGADFFVATGCYSIAMALTYGVTYMTCRHQIRLRVRSSAREA